jgi:MATE family multidrug resistance protein
MAEGSTIAGSASENRGRWAAEITATVKLAGPIALAFLAEIAIVVADAVMAGRLGEEAIAAEGLGAHLLFTPQLLAMGVLSSVAALGSHAHGAQDAGMLTRVTRQGIWLATLLSIPVVAMTALIPTLLTMAGYDSKIVGMLSGMIYVGLCGIPALLWYTALRNFATVLHKTRIVVVISLVSLAVAIGSNWLFLYGNWGAPKLGVTGVGVSWALASWVQLAIMVVYVQRERVLNAYRVMSDLMHPDWRILKDLFHVGWPISASYAFETGLFLASSLMMARFGDSALAAHTVVISISSVSYMIPYGLSQAATVRVGYYNGAGDPQSARRAGFAAIVLAIVWMVLTGAAMVLIPHQLIGLYIDVNDPANQGALAVAMMIIPIGALFQVVDGLQSAAIGALRGLKDTHLPMVICFVGYWAIGFGSSFFLTFVLDWGVQGIWLGIFVGLAASGLLLTLRFETLSRRLSRGAVAAVADAA